MRAFRPEGIKTLGIGKQITTHLNLKTNLQTQWDAEKNPSPHGRDDYQLKETKK